MKCQCGGDTHVKDTRPHASGGIWRRRACKECGLIQTTIEQACDTIRCKPGPTAGRKSERTLRVQRSKSVIHAAPVSALLRPKRVRVAPKPSASHEKPAWMRIADMREERELAQSGQ